MNPDNALSKDEILSHITLYWATGAIGSSFWPYYARLHSPWPIPDGSIIAVPTGVAVFPKELLRPPRSMAERLFTDIRRWTEHEHGGQFAATEQPAALAHDIREFFRPLRRGGA